MNLPKRARLVALMVGGTALVAVAAPVVAFGVVPLLVRSSLHEAAPAASPLPGGDPTAPAATATPTPAVSISGQLRRLDAVHRGTGLVTLVETGRTRYLRFQEVDIAGAPNMFVYLSDRDDGQPGRYTDLGPLRATTGSFNYELPAGLDLSTVRSVVVWCRAFSVTVTYAALTNRQGE